VPSQRQPSAAVYAAIGCGLLVATIAGVFARQWALAAFPILGAAYFFVVAVAARRSER
jgi:hypothetical protein